MPTIPKTVVAVAIGPTYKQANISSLDTIPSWARQYVNGFVSVNPPTIGTDYVIDYRECPAADLPTKVFTDQLQANYILCFSTTVVVAAAEVYPDTSNVKIIGIVSHPEEQLFYQQNQSNVCGVSAERSDDAKTAYEKLLNTVSPALTQATILHDKSYRPSQDSLGNIQPAYPKAPVVNVSTPDDVKTVINNAAAKTGVLLLPVDWMFGSAPNIIGWASNQNVLDFWFVTDWLVQNSNSSAFGGYGVSQKTSGTYLAQQFSAVLKGGWPKKPWQHVQPKDRDWKASLTRATQANVTLNPNNPPTGPGKV